MSSESTGESPAGVTIVQSTAGTRYAASESVRAAAISEHIEAYARRRRRERSRSAGQLVGLLVLLGFIIAPIYWMVSTAFKTTSQTFAIPPDLIFRPTLMHFREIIEDGAVPSSLQSSLIVALSATALAVVLGTPAAYALARFSFRGKADLWFWFISNRFISPVAVAIPVFLIARDLNLLDNYLTLILIYQTFSIPLVIWLCTDQFRLIPRDIDDAALVDGAGPWRTFFQINLPLVAPSLAVSAVLCFIFSWNEFLFAFILTRTPTRTAPVVANNFVTDFGVRWGPMMATGTIIVLPVVIFAFFSSRYLVRGLMMGAVK